MSTPYKIPLTAQPQIFEIELAGVTYKVTVTWNPPSSCWILDLRTTADVDVVLGIPIVTGVDLLAPYAAMNFGGALIAQTDHDTAAVPTYENLGSAGNLYFVVT